jgi:hypothetical protein
MSSERLIYLPLGGAGEIGMNCYVYGWGRPGAERLIVLDLGVTFPDMETSPASISSCPTSTGSRRAATGSRRSSSPMPTRTMWARWAISGRS